MEGKLSPDNAVRKQNNCVQMASRNTPLEIRSKNRLSFLLSICFSPSSLTTPSVIDWIKATESFYIKQKFNYNHTISKYIWNRTEVPKESKNAKYNLMQVRSNKGQNSSYLCQFSSRVPAFLWPKNCS